MTHLPVHWFEGMFLRPQHLQAADRNWAETLYASECYDHQYNYGLRTLELSQDAIANHQIEVKACKARMRDGTLISLESGQGLDRVSLKEAFAKESAIRVFLAVSKLHLGRANVGPPGQQGVHRYSEAEQLQADESKGGNDQEIQHRVLNVQILLSTQDLSGFEVLPIAQIERSGERESVPRLDSKYIPPLLACDAWPVLDRDIVRAIYDIVGKKIEVLSEQILLRGITLSASEPGDLDRVLMLSVLNAAYTTLGVMGFALGQHPLLVYTELCRLVGQLSIFGSDRRPPEIPKYDHDDIAGIFYAVKKEIERLIGAVREYQYEQRYFVGTGLGMQVTLEPKWLNMDWQWYVGVHKGDLAEREGRDLLSPGQMDWKLGSSRQVEILFKHRAEGLQLMPLERAPRALPHSKDWIYYEVSRGNAAWKDVFETQTLAMRLKDTMIVNRDNLQGKDKMLVLYRGQNIPLQFALFAVPAQK
jgi:type VI secretion system protein ImpJ